MEYLLAVLAGILTFIGGYFLGKVDGHQEGYRKCMKIYLEYWKDIQF